MSRQVRPVRAPTRRLAAALLAAFALALAIVAFACGFDDEGTQPPLVIPPDTSPQLEASPIPPQDGEAAKDAGVDSPVPTRGCPKGLAGPVMVQYPDGGFCIDSTEVTNADYEGFLTATNGGELDAGIPDGGLPAVCAAAVKKTFARSGSVDGGAGNRPVARVAWCDAYAFCAYAGKRLCAGPDGGTAGRKGGEWYLACSAGDTRRYPYGDAHVDNACNDNPGNGALAVGSLPQCEGGISGLFDMVGNVQEWVSTCDDVASACDTAGGSFGAGPSSSDCPEIETLGRDYTADLLGFRCCADVR